MDEFERKIIEQIEILAILAIAISIISLIVVGMWASDFKSIEKSQEDIIAKHNVFVEYAYDKMNKTENRLERDEKYLATLYLYRAYDAVQGKEIDGNASGRIVTNIGTWG